MIELERNVALGNLVSAVECFSKYKWCIEDISVSVLDYDIYFRADSVNNNHITICYSLGIVRGKGRNWFSYATLMLGKLVNYGSGFVFADLAMNDIRRCVHSDKISSRSEIDSSLASGIALYADCDDYYRVVDLQLIIERELRRTINRLIGGLHYA